MLVDAHRHRAATERLEARLIREVPGATVPDEALFHTVCQCVRDLAHALQPEYRDILQRVELDDALLSEVAEACDMTPNNASVRLHRARKALRTALMHMCGICAEHGCVDCTCRHPGSPSPSACGNHRVGERCGGALALPGPLRGAGHSSRSLV